MTDIGSQLIKLNEYPVRDVLEILLRDRTTGKNIIFATNEYAFAYERDEITVELINGEHFNGIHPRFRKTVASQAARTKERAEVFTQSWARNKMTNHCDEEGFGRMGVCNTEYIDKDGSHGWRVNGKMIEFPEGKTWKDYVLSKRLEITCGEAPFIVSRYDATNSKISEDKNEPVKVIENDKDSHIIEVEKRIGILDRKLRVVTENAKDEKDWREWAYKAFQSVYGYEFQGDNLLIARVNLLMTFVDYMKAVWGKKPTKQQLTKIAEIVSWNLWQMDGLKGTVPFEDKPEEDYEYTGNLFLAFADGEPVEEEKTDVECKIKDWQTGKTLKFSDIRRG